MFHATLYYEQGRHFPWTVPVANLAVLMVPGLLVAGANRLRPGLVSRAGRRLAVRHAGDLGAAAEGAPVRGGEPAPGRRGGPLDQPGGREARGRHSSARASCLAVLAALVGATAASSLRRQALAESRALAACRHRRRRGERPADRAGYRPRRQPEPLRLPARHHAQPGALGEEGGAVRLGHGPAPWTFPSHGSFFTGQWPSTLNAHWRPALDATHPTLAEFLAARGYLTAGFAANTNLVQLRVGDGPRVRPLRGLSADAADRPGQHHAGPLGPQEPAQPRRLLRRQVDPLPIPRREGDQPRIPGLAVS